MGKPAARVTDFHACPMVTPGVPPIPHVGGPILPPCSVNVLTGKLPQARVGDMALCVGPPDSIVMGSTGVFVNKMPAARIGDPTAHGGAIALGLPTVLIGETKGGGGGAGTPESGVSSDDFTGGHVPLLAYTAYVEQVQAIIQAAESGAPFCEVCFQAAQQQLKDSRT